MENYKKYLMQNTELILKEVIKSKDPLSFLTDDIDSVISEPDSLQEYEVVLAGEKTTSYKEGDFILCRKDIVKPIKHPDFKGVIVLFNELGAFSKVDK
jgi:flavodoxin